MTAFDLHPRLRAHSHIGSQGWELVQMPQDHPPRAIARYRRGESEAWLIEDGEEYRLELADHNNGDRNA